MIKFESFAKDRKRIIAIIYLFSNLERPKVRDKNDQVFEEHNSKFNARTLNNLSHFLVEVRRDQGRKLLTSHDATIQTSSSDRRLAKGCNLCDSWLSQTFRITKCGWGSVQSAQFLNLFHAGLYISSKSDSNTETFSSTAKRLKMYWVWLKQQMFFSRTQTLKQFYIYLNHCNFLVWHNRCPKS